MIAFERRRQSGSRPAPFSFGDVVIPREERFVDIRLRKSSICPTAGIVMRIPSSLHAGPVGESVVYAEEVTMVQLLQFAVTYLAELFEDFGFTIIASKNSGNRFAGASILLASSDVEIFLAIERDEITALFRSLFDKKKNNWFSAEIALSLLGHRECVGVMDSQTASVLRDELPELMRRFGESEAGETVRVLGESRKARAGV